MRLSKDKENNSIKLSEGASRESLKKMGTSWNRLWFGGSHNRYEEFTRLLNDLASDLKPLIIQPEPGKPKLTGIKLYVYGFSRGAAAARTFVRWLSELLPPPAAEGEKPPQCLQTGGMQLPVSVEFLGLLDTVASVGVAHVVPVADGHMSWADGTMELPDDETYGGLIKNVFTWSPGMSSVSAFRWTRCAGQTANTRPVPLRWFTRGCTRILVEDIRRGSRGKRMVRMTAYCYLR